MLFWEIKFIYKEKNLKFEKPFKNVLIHSFIPPLIYSTNIYWMLITCPLLGMFRMNFRNIPSIINSSGEGTIPSWLKAISCQVFHCDWPALRHNQRAQAHELAPIWHSASLWVADRCLENTNSFIHSSLLPLKGTLKIIYFHFLAEKQKAREVKRLLQSCTANHWQHGDWNSCY